MMGFSKMTGCIHCGKEITTNGEHGELCPHNFVNGVQLSHGLSLKDYVKVTAMDFVFSPTTQADLVIAELPFEDTISKIADEDTPLDIRIAGKSYRVNIGASRLRIFKKNPVCCCCGIRATEATLDLDAQQTKDAGENRYHVNLYARTGDRLTGKTHLVLFTKDHIIARSRGGADDNDNAQTLCFNCNTLKDNTQLDLEHMRLALFPAYRAYQSSKALTLAKERLHNAFFQDSKKPSGAWTISPRHLKSSRMNEPRE